jgi:phosphoribosylaminoimidazole-succinocarboxamide synthase
MPESIRELLKNDGFKVEAMGKTKVVMCSNEHLAYCYLVSTDSITAGDGKRKDTLPGKGILSTETTCNVFTLLKKRGFPLAFIERNRADSFFSFYTDMFPLEVVVRRYVGEKSSYRKRHSRIEPNHCFAVSLPVEFFLKTSGRQFRGKELPCDDPFLAMDTIGGCRAYRPDIPISQQKSKPLLKLAIDDLGFSSRDLSMMKETARAIFITLEAAWKNVGARLEDMKIEFGRTQDGKLVVADVIDNDSWRLFYNGRYVCKQPYRDGASLEDVLRDYKLVAEMSSRLQ